MRVSLSFTFLVFTLVCLIAGFYSWLGPLGLVLAFWLFGCPLVLFGLAKNNAQQTYLGFAVLSAFVAILFIDSSGSTLWSGQSTLEFDLTVVDANTGLPVQDVKVTVGTLDLDMREFSVDSQGKALFSQDFPLGGHDSALGIAKSSREFSLVSYWLKVTTRDGLEQTYSLAEAVGQNEWPMSDSALPPIVLRFERK